ncbi:MAG: ABC transporter permease [Lachnospiraceae bacterium]|nr:ABC transporter permease [Lachnospiraceae bacterium]
MIVQSIKMAWSSIASNKMRSFLTMLGIIIGVASLIVLVSIANGATGSVTDAISSMGNNLLTVTIQDDKENPLRLSELSDFVDETNISMAAPIAQASVTAKSGYTSEDATAYGTTGPYYDIQGLELAFGRWLKKSDVDNNTYVVVLNAYAATQLIGRTSCVGESIALNGKKYEIVGVLKEEENSLSSESNERLEAYIPYTSLTRLADNVLYVTSFYAASADEKSMDAAENTLTQKMLERFGNDEEAFTIVNQSAVMETMQSVTNTLAWMLGGIAAISLVVGGIGIMNIMLVSVTERTKEIGIRKAIGAGRGSIMAQFLIEALMISLMGCLIGLGLSAVILKIVSFFVTDMSFSISPQVVAVAVGFSAFIGVAFGIYPANKAARKHPIDALRFS